VHLLALSQPEPKSSAKGVPRLIDDLGLYPERDPWGFRQAHLCMDLAYDDRDTVHPSRVARHAVLHGVRHFSKLVQGGLQREESLLELVHVPAAFGMKRVVQDRIERHDSIEE